MGTPPTPAPAGTSLFTRLMALTTAPSPIVTPGNMVQLAPMVTLAPMCTRPTRYSLIKYLWAKMVVL